MNKLLIPIIMLLISVNVHAQRPNKAKIKALKIAHITEQLNLTEKEAQAFWPIYNAHEEAREKLTATSEMKRRNKNIDALTEAEARDHLESMVKLEAARQKLQRDFFLKLKAVLTAKKMLKLMETERSFRRRLIKEFKERHRGERG